MPARILVVDDMPDNIEIAKLRLEKEGYAVATAVDGEDALAKVAEAKPDLILLDVMMPKMDGIEATRRLKADKSLPFIPIVLLTAKAATKDVIAGLDAGADDYLTKPFEHSALVARVRAMLRIKALHDEVAALNTDLEARVARQVGEIERIGKLKRFLAPQVAEAMVAQGDAILEPHRRDIVVLFCDLRGFTGFAESAEPEDIMRVLGEYHAALGPIIHRHEATLERFLGDGLMLVLNDPVPCPDAPVRAVRMANEMRTRIQELAGGWAGLGHTMGFGIGIAQGYATLGRIGFEGRFDYSAIGTVANVASRLCGEAQDGQIVVTQRIATAVGTLATCEPLGNLTLKGLARPVAAFNVAALREQDATP
ncbi:MAG: response regulator [Alphaproteobacteria bacterium]|nr:response regulator [Alphaproteobacteria bacterium]